MKKFLFAHFLNMIRQDHGPELLNKVMAKTKALEGENGHYSAAFMRILGEETKMTPAAILSGFGEYLFGMLIRSYPSMMKGITHPLDFIVRVESFIHTRFKKQYPEAELPEFSCKRLSDDTLELIYESTGQLENICDGLIRGVLSHYHKSAVIEREALSGTEEKFLVKLAPT